MSALSPRAMEQEISNGIFHINCLDTSLTFTASSVLENVFRLQYILLLVKVNKSVFGLRSATFYAALQFTGILEVEECGKCIELNYSCRILQFVLTNDNSTAGLPTECRMPDGRTGTTAPASCTASYFLTKRKGKTCSF